MNSLFNWNCFRGRHVWMATHRRSPANTRDWYVVKLGCEKCNFKLDLSPLMT